MDDERKQEIFEFLDRLRESCVTNMLGAMPYIRDEYEDVTVDEAGVVLTEWMVTFDARHPE